MHYVTVFDASQNIFRYWWVVGLGLVFVAIGAVLVLRPGIAAILGQRKPGRLFSWFFFLFGTVWTISAAVALFGSSSAASGHAKRRDCSTIEGRVQNFHPMPAEGHDLESFDVAGVHFAYSDFVLSSGFNNAASRGGPIREGLPVRICHRDGDILILEVAR